MRSLYLPVRFFLLVVVMLTSQDVFSVNVEQEAPPFTLGGMANVKPGQKISLSDYKGKVVYLDFWASWCGPCRKSLPALNDIRNKYASRGFEVIAINVDENPEDGLKFLREFSVSYPVAYDPKGAVPATYQLKGMPYAFLIDRQGTVHHIHEGYREGDQAKIETMVKALLGK